MMIKFTFAIPLKTYGIVEKIDRNILDVLFSQEPIYNLNAFRLNICCLRICQSQNFVLSE
jgi:hypothetical protein